MSSLAELRKELKEIRKSTVHPVSRMKKADLLAELAKHKGSSTVAPVPVAVKEEVKVEAPVKKAPVKKAPVKKVAKEVAEEKVAPIKVPKEKKVAPKKEKAEPKAKKSVDPAPVKTETTVLSKHMKSKD